jgi:quinol-cytochrome oxidoreductase complex cytochrome b subunit
MALSLHQSIVEERILYGTSVVKYYLLPWDQLAFWAITVGTSVAGYAPVFGPTIKTFLLGGPEVGQESLTRFYALHIMLIPTAILLLTSLHIWRVRKDGGLAANEVKEDEKR